MTDIVRMMAVYNEIDILSRNLEWYERAGIRTVIVDNGSTDGSFELCRQAEREGRIAALEQVVTGEFQWVTLLAALHRLACSQNPDWLMLTAPDEFFETANGEELGTAIRRDINAGCNVIKFYNMEFWMTERDDPDDPDPLSRMQHYSCYDVDMDRAYPNIDGLDLLRWYGHRPVFPDGIPRIRSDTVYVSRHYKLRSIEQARRKIGRVRPNKVDRHLHHHYRNFTSDAAFIVPSARLHRYRFDHVWQLESVFDGNRGRPRRTRMPHPTAMSGARE